MKDKNNKNIKEITSNYQDGYILMFTLVLMSILLFISLSVSRIIEKEMLSAKVAENNRTAYFAADIGMECAQYIDDLLRDDSLGTSLFLNSVSNDAEFEFNINAENNVFFSTSTLNSLANSLNFKEKIFCASDGTYNRIFNKDIQNNEIGFVSSQDSVFSYLNNKKSSYTIIGDGGSATTIFGLVIRDKDSNNQDIYRCALVQVSKVLSTGYSDTSIASSTDFLSTGFSSCNISDRSRVSRTIERYSTN